MENGKRYNKKNNNKIKNKRIAKKDFFNINAAAARLLKLNAFIFLKGICVNFPSKTCLRHFIHAFDENFFIIIWNFSLVKITIIRIAPSQVKLFLSYSLFHFQRTNKIIPLQFILFLFFIHLFVSFSHFAREWERESIHLISGVQLFAFDAAEAAAAARRKIIWERYLKVEEKWIKELVKKVFFFVCKKRIFCDEEMNAFWSKRALFFLFVCWVSHSLWLIANCRE